MCTLSLLPFPWQLTRDAVVMTSHHSLTASPELYPNTHDKIQLIYLQKSRTAIEQGKWWLQYKMLLPSTWLSAYPGTKRMGKKNILFKKPCHGKYSPKPASDIEQKIIWKYFFSLYSDQYQDDTGSPYILNMLPGISQGWSAVTS